MLLSSARRPLCTFAVLPLALTLAACGGDDASGPAEVVLQDPASISYAPSLGVDLSAMELQASGLYIRDLQEGEGEPTVAGDVMVVHYSGWLNDGTLFDSSHSRNTPFAVPIGAGRVIAGWEEGLPGMRVGGVRQLVIPPQLAYGAQSPSPLIPAGSVLIFEVELVEVNPGS